MSSLKGLASIAKGLSGGASADLMLELAASSEKAAPARTVSAQKPLAKTRNHEYKRVMILIRKTTEKAAYRKWEDANPERDFSDLVESLLQRYADGQISV